MRIKGQVTAFIIVAVVLIALIAILMYTTGKVQTEQTEAETRAGMISEGAVNIRNFVTGCLRETLENGIGIVGAQGGYIYPSEIPGYLDFKGTPIHYGYLLGYNTLPDREDIAELEIERYILDRLGDCTDDFVTFKHLGTITSKEARPQVVINDDSVSAVLTMPVTIRSPRYVETVSDYSVTVSVRLGHLLDISHIISDSAVLNPNWIDATYNEAIDVDVDTVQLEEEQLIYTLTDKSAPLKGAPYVFSFAMAFHNNSAPEMLPIPDMTVRVGKTETYHVAAVEFDEEPLLFRLDSPVGTIDAHSGVITVTPTADQIGSHLAVVHVVDTFGFDTVQPFYIEVQP